MMNIAVDDTITLELLRNDHAAPLAELTDANRPFLRQCLPWLDLSQSVADTTGFIQHTMRQHRLGCGVQFGIIQHGEAPEIIGVIGFTRIDKLNKSGVLGYWLAEEHNGKGIISRSVVHLLELGFVEFELHKIEIHCAVHNRRGRAIPERLGFVHEATLRDCERLYGKFVDHAIYSLLENEYRSA